MTGPPARWRLLFPGLSKEDWDVWFMEVTLSTGSPLNQKYQLVNELFKARGLYSFSYIQAAVDCITEWEKQNQPLTEPAPATGQHA